MRTLMQIAEDARRSKYAVAKLGTNDKNRGILAIADTLMAHADEIIAANRIDIENGRAAGLNDGLIDRTKSALRALLRAAVRWRHCPTRSVRCFGCISVRTA